MIDLATYLDKCNYATITLQSGVCISGYIDAVGGNHVVIDEDKAFGDIVVIKYEDILMAEGRQLKIEQRDYGEWKLTYDGVSFFVCKTVLVLVEHMVCVYIRWNDEKLYLLKINREILFSFTTQARRQTR